METDAQVALKQCSDPHHDARFEVEARLLSSLQHPRVVRIIDHFSTRTGQFLVMDLVKGRDLGMLIKQHGDPGLPLDQSTEYVRQTCEALQYVHDQQIVHRDVKPQNIILAENGIVLVDFGIARVLDEEEQQGTVGIGTPRFMAPEVFAGGQRVAAHRRVQRRGDAVDADRGPPAGVRRPDQAFRPSTPRSPPELERTIAAGLEMIPERRVASVAAFAKALGAPLRTETGVSLAVSIDDPDASRTLMEAVVHTAAGVFGAAAASICADRRDHRRARLPVCLGRRRARDRRRPAPPRRRHRRPGGQSRRCPRRFRTAAPTRASPPGSRRAPATSPTRC